jgi:hypothetical protein
VAVEINPHETWFLSKVQEALNDSGAATTHFQAMHQVQVLIDEKRRLFAVKED